MTFNLALEIVFKFIVFPVIIGINCCGHVKAQSETVQEKAKLIAGAIYGNGVMNANQVIELVGSNPEETMPILTATVYQQENNLSHLLAKRGHIAALFHLIDKLDPVEKTQLVKRLNHSYKEGFLIQHRVLLFAYSPYWIRQFESLGFDFSAQVKMDGGQKKLRDIVVLTWGEESEAYRYVRNIKNRKTSEDSNNLSSEGTTKLIEKINHVQRPAIKGNDAMTIRSTAETRQSNTRPHLWEPTDSSEVIRPVKSILKQQGGSNKKRE